MSSILGFEMRRAFSNRLFLVAIGINCLIVLSHIAFEVAPNSPIFLDDYYTVRQAYGEYPLSVFNTWIGGQFSIIQVSLYFFILPLVVCVPFTDSLFSDRKTGYARNIATRTDYKKYYGAKIVAVFLSAGVVAVAPLVLDFLLTMLFFPALIPEPSAGTFALGSASLGAELFYSQPFAYVALFLLYIFLFSGLLALSALLFTYLVDNRFIVLLAPFICCVFADFILTSLPGRFELFSPSQLLRPDQPYALQPLPMLAVTVGLTVVLAVFLLRKMHRDEVY